MTQNSIRFLTIGRLAVLAVAIFAISTQVIAQDGWTLDARSVPPPAAVSKELHDAIAGAPKPDAATQWGMIPDNDDGWRAMQNATAMMPLDPMAEQFGVSVEKKVIAGVTVFAITPKEPSTAHADHVFLHVHGGGYVLGGGNGSATEAIMAAGTIGMTSISVDYRMPPDHPFPAAVNDTVTVYKHLLKSHDANAIVIGGTSAGGGLAMAAVHRFKELSLDVPGAIYAGTPWADLTKTGDTLFTNEGLDRVLVSYDGLLDAAAKLYADGTDLKDPLLSPVYGDFAGFPPTYFVTGTRDMFLSDTVRTHRKMRAAGVIVDLNVYEGMSHAEYLMVAASPESRDMFTGLGAFLKQHLP
ncbi:MAG: alpha/beta hydrolase [Acidobacteriota bacterium]|nr:alpha/beta hydrolase [Acidobacteriota bacterium]